MSQNNNNNSNNTFVLPVSYRPSFSPTFTPNPTTSIEPTIFPSNPPTDKPTPLPLPNDPTTTIEIFDLSQDKYGVWRIPLIVIGMSLFHLIAYLLIKQLLRKNTQFANMFVKTKPLSNKDKDRHVIAKVLLVICTCLSLIFTLWFTISCKFASVGGRYHIKSTQRISFGIWRFENESNKCEAMDVYDPAHALVGSRVFSILTCIILGTAFILICFLCLLNTPSVWSNQTIYNQFPKQRQYKMWIVAISMVYTSMWTTIYVFFIFGLNICHQPIEGYEGQYCKKGGSAKLALYNIFFLLFITILGVWYMWDALTPRPMTKDAAAANMRPSKARQPIEVVDNNNPIPINIIDEGGSERSKASSSRKSPKSPSKKPPVKISQDKSPMKSSQQQQQQQRSPRPGTKKSVSVNNNNNNDSRGFDSSISRSPRPGTKRSQSANNVKKGGKQNNNNNSSPPQNISPLSMRSARQSKGRTPRKSSSSPKKKASNTTPNSSRSANKKSQNAVNTTMPSVPDLLDDNDDSSLEITKPRM